MKNYILLNLFSLLAILLVGCDDKEPAFSGVNKIYLTSEGALTLNETEDTKLTIDIDLTLASEKDLILNFEILDNNENVIKLEGNPVTIKAGVKKGSFQVTSSQLALLNEQKYFKIGIPILPEVNMALEKAIEILVKPDVRIPELTEAQKILIEGYKSKYNFDLNEWLGAVSYEVTIKSPATEYLDEDFTKPFTKNYKGRTIIVLDEKSTAIQPILKMTDNPMGMTEYLYWLLRKESVENPNLIGEYASPNFQAMVNKIGLSATSVESFSMSLDNIRLDMNTTPINVEFMGDVYGDVIGIPYLFKYSAWERLQKLDPNSTLPVMGYDGNMSEITVNEVIAGGGTCNPEAYLIYSTIEYDDWGNDPSDWIQPKASIDTKTGKMEFIFSFDHYSASGYTQVKVTYTK